MTTLGKILIALEPGDLGTLGPCNSGESILLTLTCCFMLQQADHLQQVQRNSGVHLLVFLAKNSRSSLVGWTLSRGT